MFKLKRWKQNWRSKLFLNWFLNPRSLIVFFTENCFQLIAIVNAKEVSCERFGDADFYWSGSRYPLKTCLMDKSTTIKESDSKILTRDETVLGLLLDSNKNIIYLPIGVAEKFPTLQAYDAWACSIKVVSKINFKALKKLKRLCLSSNQIETIPTDAFSDLIELEHLSLGKVDLNFELWIFSYVFVFEFSQITTTSSS